MVSSGGIILLVNIVERKINSIIYIVYICILCICLNLFSFHTVDVDYKN